VGDRGLHTRALDAGLDLRAMEQRLDFPYAAAVERAKASALAAFRDLSL
jgi:hypothetical protein